MNCLAGIPPKDAPAADGPPHLRRQSALRRAGVRRKAGIRLLVEPINTRDIPGFYLNRSAQAIEIMDEVGSDNLFLQYDFYHMQIMEGDLVPTFRRLKDRIGHVQIADNARPQRARHRRDQLSVHLRGARRAGYDGWVGCEYKPATTTAAGLGWFAPYRRSAA